MKLAKLAPRPDIPLPIGGSLPFTAAAAAAAAAAAIEQR